MAWPYGIPPDPHLYAYLAAAAASYPYGVMGGAGMLPGDMGSGDPHGQPLPTGFPGSASGVSPFSMISAGGGVPPLRGMSPHPISGMGHPFSSLHSPASLVPPPANAPVRSPTNSPGDFIPSAYLGSTTAHSNERGRISSTSGGLRPAYGLGGHASPHIHHGLSTLGNLAVGAHGLGLSSSPSHPAPLSSQHPLFRSSLDITAMSQLLAAQASSLQQQQQHHHHQQQQQQTHLSSPQSFLSPFDTARLATFAPGSRIPFSSQISPHFLSQSQPRDDRDSPRYSRSPATIHTAKVGTTKVSPERANPSPVQPHSTRPDSTADDPSTEESLKLKLKTSPSPPKGLFRPF